MTAPHPPAGGTAPPGFETIAGSSVPLAPLAVEICARYRAEFGDEEGRYGDAGAAWCVHDVQWLLSWAALEERLPGTFAGQLEWLAGVLAARGFPLERLARCLELAAAVVGERLGDGAGACAERLRHGAETVRPGA